MLSHDDEARRKRAAKLREQIAQITGGKRDKGGGSESDTSTEDRSVASTEGKPSDDESVRNAAQAPSISPREFINRRMRELHDSQDKGTKNDK
jgi:hypothetical protein